VTLRGVTPYLPEKAVSPKVAECRRVEIPQCDLLLLDYANEDDRIAAIRAWLNGNEQVEQLRIEGLWSDLSDRILEGSAFFRAAEHSAQQPGARLADYESKFKSGRINLLSCSTTMEMGVDIGGISVVAMNNVPPHPANYLQRAGRAGRRAETRSVALALCKNNPHDQNVLRNTLWPFTSRLPAPTVLLSSRIVIQRHINSMLLAEFMRAEMSGSGSAEKLNLEWWMLPKDSARIRRFCSWARCFEPSRQPMLARGLRSLLRHTPYDGIATLDNLTAEAARMAEAHALNWFGEFDAIETELSRFNVTTQSIEPAFKALSFQRKRLTGEYLLRELATGGFLPGYGFPTDISSFETLTCDEVARMKAKPEREGDRGRIDNRMRVRDLPSRDTVTALREYAPGAEVVIDGLVYRSSGITLNWHAPASNADVSEIQNIREAWRCRRCGSSGTHVRAAQISACPDCGASLPLDPEARFSYLQPAGFSVDLYDVPHNDVSVQTYVPVAAPWVNAQGEWRPLSNPALGFHRSSTSGIVFNHSAGSNDQGFAVCLYCGRAEPMELNGELPHVFFDRKSGKRREHRRLRGSQGGDTAICEGSNSGFAVMPALRLGHEARTDVLELLLCDTDSEPIKDRKIAYTLAVAIRNAIAKLLGVESSELGCDSKPVLMIKGRIGQAIVVFDKRAAGYCSSVSGRLQQVLTHARLELECQSSCQDACQHCLLDYETRFRVDDLDRHAALGFLTARWMADFALPIERAYFGVGASVAEHQSLIEAITRELAFPGGQPLHLFLAGRPEDWDIAGSSLRRCVTRWISSGEEVRIILSESAASCASLPDRAILHALQSLEGVSIRVGCAPSCLHGATVLAAIGGDGGAIAWASDSSSIAIPDSRWGDVAGASITRGRVENAGALADRLSFDVTPPAAGTVRLEISGELDGAVVGFGERVLSAIEGKLGEPLIPSGIEVASVTYHDRYLNSPLPLALLLDFVSCVRTRYKDQWDRQGFSLFVAPMKDKQGGLSPNRVWDDWPDSEVRDSVINAAFEYAGWEVELKRVDKRDVSHSRRLDFHLSDGKCIQVWFDQGFGYWRAQRSQGDNRFPFSQTVEVQAETVAGMRSAVEGQSYSTIMFIGR
jgi:DEAD/DEAH box helicase domain-containing protein